MIQYVELEICLQLLETLLDKKILNTHMNYTVMN